MNNYMQEHNAEENLSLSGQQIEAKDLRVGCFISPKYESDLITPRQVLRIEPNGVYIQFGIAWKDKTSIDRDVFGQEPERFFSFDEIKPIPLNPDIMKDMGFAKGETEGLLFKDGVSLLECFDEADNCYEYQLNVQFPDGGLKIFFARYVHELQVMLSELLKNPIYVSL